MRNYCPSGAIANVAMGFNPSDHNVLMLFCSQSHHNSVFPVFVRQVKTRRYFGNAPLGQWETSIIPLAKTIHYSLLTINY
ncbi:MAG: hypothetical protein LBP87_06510 [Planctomycetaceae bacterium]|nr:hypothetical protein [Planctomycetaceae bacterium]